MKPAPAHSLPLRDGRRRLLPLLCCALVLGAASVVPKDAHAQAAAPAAEALVWPKPPAPARIRFVRNVSKPDDWGLTRGFFQRLMDKITGQQAFRFVRPTGVAARGTTLYVTDPGAQALVILDSSAGEENLVRRIGSEFLASPVAVALGPRDTVFISDSALRKIYVLDGKGMLLRTIGGESSLGRPTGIAYDSAADRLYVADSAAHRIVVFASDGRQLQTIGNNGNGAGEFNYPTHLALSRDGELLVTDTLNFRIQVLSSDGRPLASMGRVGDGSGDFASPKGVAADSAGNLYVVDALFDAVQVFDRAGALLLGFGNRGTRPGQFWLPNGLFIDDKDRVYVADAYNQRIGVFERLAPPALEATR